MKWTTMSTVKNAALQELETKTSQKNINNY